MFFTVPLFLLTHVYSVMNKSRLRDKRILRQYSRRRILAYSNPVQSQYKHSLQPHASLSSDNRDYLKPAGVVLGVVGVLIIFFVVVLCGGGADTRTRTAAGQSV